MLWYLPVSPWSWSYAFACIISVRLNRGFTFLLLSFHTFIALVHPLHGNHYSLTLISIDGHLHSPLIRLVDVRLSSPFCLLHNHHSIPPIVLYLLRESWKSLRTSKLWNNCLACHRGCAWLNILCDDIPRLYDLCSDPTSDGQVYVLKCHPWIGMLTHTVLEDL